MDILDPERASASGLSGVIDQLGGSNRDDDGDDDMPAERTRIESNPLEQIARLDQLVEKQKTPPPQLLRGNTPARCYVCKKAVIERGWEIAGMLGADARWDGTNLDDLDDFRPGLKAARELGVASPLLEAGLGKREIRELSRRLGLPWDRPPQSCLATRFPAYTELTAENLARVGRAETWLKARGFSHVRLRVRDEDVVLELRPEEWAKFLDPEVRRPFHALITRLGWQGFSLATD
jgi:uncharacterized protein